MRQGQKRGSGFLEEPGSDQLQLQTSTFGRSDVRGALVRLRRLLGSQRCFPWICQSLGVSGSSGTESALGPRTWSRNLVCDIDSGWPCSLGRRAEEAELVHAEVQCEHFNQEDGHTEDPLSNTGPTRIIQEDLPILNHTCKAP
ncbi:uncharacterized protein LOC128626158 isoform X2 [Artibeus jamaicensis]|uniref:uncharacterized protein LOC128626158 isoform X2 n=1 Tax=Artibeus jamaicensis TaxID=9417 RepID=UPI00235A5138|nr:uncharacterized protein LOC128626158 isoform X2 [Artibeus jamaicensis]